MAIKGQKFKRYSSDFKLNAVLMYENGDKSYKTLAKELGLQSPTQLKDWVKKYRENEMLEDQRGKTPKKDISLIGRPKTVFNSVEEERDYLKVQVEYLKKRYLNLYGEEEIPKAKRFEFIHTLRKKYCVSSLVRMAKVTRAGYYKWIRKAGFRKERLEKEQDIRNHIVAIHKAQSEFGYPRVTTELRRQGIIVNHKRVYRLMKDLGIQSIIRKKRPFYGKEVSVVYPNRVNRSFKNRGYNEVLATDITYIPFQNRFYYLSVVQDLFNNEIVSWKISKRNDLSLVMDTIKDICTKRDVQGTILHSDQGFQYTSKQYKKLLDENGIIGSHSRKGNCLDNACIESFFSHFKVEKLYRLNCKTEQELVQAIDHYMDYYNYKRFQKRLNQCSPVEYRVALAA